MIEPCRKQPTMGHLFCVGSPKKRQMGLALGAAGQGLTAVVAGSSFLNQIAEAKSS